MLSMHVELAVYLCNVGKDHRADFVNQCCDPALLHAFGIRLWVLALQVVIFRLHLHGCEIHAYKWATAA